MNGYRRAALALHGLPEPDRHWVLAQLPDADRARVAQLLEELKKLGIPPDASLLADAQKRLPAVPAPSRIREASAAQMLAILSREPAGLIAAVLRIETWPWQEALLARLDSAVRERVRIALNEEVRMSEKLAATLRSSIEARLNAPAKPGVRLARAKKLAAWVRGRSHRAREMFSGMVARWAR